MYQSSVQFAIATICYIEEFFWINTRQAKVMAHGGPLESVFAEIEEAGSGVREPLGFEPVARELILARGGRGRHVAFG